MTCQNISDCIHVTSSDSAEESGPSVCAGGPIQQWVHQNVLFLTARSVTDINTCTDCSALACKVVAVAQLERDKQSVSVVEMAAVQTYMTC